MQTTQSGRRMMPRQRSCWIRWRCCPNKLRPEQMERHWEMFLKLLGLSCAAASLCASVVSAERGRQAMVRGIQIDRMDARKL